MEDLGKYYNDQNWQHVLSKVVPVEFNKCQNFYDEIKKDEIFPDDVYKVLATFSQYMFHGRITEYKSWLIAKHKMLNGLTPLEIVHTPMGLESLKEYLLRYPKI